MLERTNTHHEVSRQDELSLYAQNIETALDRRDFSTALDLIERDWACAWFALGPTKMSDLLYQLPREVLEDRFILRTVQDMLMTNSFDTVDSSTFLSEVDFSNPRQAHWVTILRAGVYRLVGRSTEALEQIRLVEQQVGQVQSLISSPGGWELHITVQVGVSALLAGDLTQALTSFTRAQMHAPIPKYAFLTRDSLAKSALIHASFGNTTTAKSLLRRERNIPRTSSWVESHIDAHRDFAKALLPSSSLDEAYDMLQAIDLHDIGELWPFYILAVHRVLEAGGHYDELEYQLEMFDDMDFPRRDGDGLSGSVIPLKRALLALRTGRIAEAQEFLDRADQNFPYTQLLQAAAHVYAGRTQQAIQDATRLRKDTRGFRLLEIRRLAILAAAQYQSYEEPDCLETLARAVEVPRGLNIHEVALFSPETRELAMKKIAGWPTEYNGPSAFLTGLPRPGLALTDREVEIIALLAKGLTRAQMADKMFISVNTLKTHLKAIYRKLGVSTAADAVLGAQRRGLI